ncbi:MAG: hypothetical protein ACYCU7_08080 [Acidimicrobiales bacterium]
MTANAIAEATDLLDAAVAWLQEQLPPTWTVARSNRTVADGNRASPQPLVDGAIDIQGTQGIQVTMAVEVKRSFQPRDVGQILPGVSRVLRTLAGNVPLLVVAPWLSARTRELLAAEGINYIDLTGNARIALEYPALYVKTVGADRDPSPAERPAARARGPKAGRLVRLLVDVSPPYGVREIAEATKLNPGYLSRLLDTLDSEALIERSRGRVMWVDISALMQRWAQSYDVFKTNATATFLSPAGAATAQAQLPALANERRVAVTGSFVAVRRAPVAAPAMLVLYCDDVAATAETLQLLPADTGANVALLSPFDEVVWERTTAADGVTYVAPSQASIDCLTGNGRMPAEGEALLAWMLENETEWREPSLSKRDRPAIR